MPRRAWKFAEIFCGSAKSVSFSCLSELELGRAHHEMDQVAQTRVSHIRTVRFEKLSERVHFLFRWRGLEKSLCQNIDDVARLCPQIRGYQFCNVDRVAF